MSEDYTIHQFKQMALRSFAASTLLRWTILSSGDVSFQITHSDGSEVTFTAPRTTMMQLLQDWRKVIEQESEP